MKKILVIGSSNVDLIFRVDKFPNDGETILATSFEQNLGGKGLNQAIAAKLSGANVKFLTAIGNDSNGKYILNEVKKYGLDIYPIIKDCETGSAAILVNNQNSENQIVVSGGANIKLNKEDIDNNIELIKECDYLLLQLEIPLNVIEYVIKLADIYNKEILLNPAPYKNIDLNILKKISYITPNEGELYQLVNHYSNDYVKNTNVLLNLGIKNILVTLGKNGSYLVNDTTKFKMESIKVNSIDTTGAGDCYNGVFLSFLTQGYSIFDSMKYATIASAMSVQKIGAAKSYPTKEEILNFSD